MNSRLQGPQSCHHRWETGCQCYHSSAQGPCSHIPSATAPRPILVTVSCWFSGSTITTFTVAGHVFSRASVLTNKKHGEMSLLSISALIKQSCQIAWFPNNHLCDNSHLCDNLGIQRIAIYPITARRIASSQVKHGNNRDNRDERKGTTTVVGPRKGS